ncbi:pyridoxal phosphate-dependent aminotransferase [Vulgatibacter incomptus]|uniref:Aminotransferase n=1 Tax=Vulgatibacter incomptus TaxID=1391653 RepID=A0A0K1PBI7_9BACT|nr:pyridoxal phosphate-dependent aminotransferase [Vulgatibacter incomptus]AKU90489.1 Aspartate aminotransferase [Vulgatibacter incomptus]
MKLSRRVNAIQPSPTLAITAKAKALSARGIDVVSLGAGEPDMDTPAHVKQAGVAAIEQGFTKYTATPGTPDLRRAIAAKMARENHLAYDETEVIASVGAKHAIFNAFQALVDEGDEVLIPAPYWVSYPDMVLLAGGKPVIVPSRAEDGFVPRPEAIAERLSDRTAAIVLNSPSNPTGAVWSREVLGQIASVLEGHSCAIISDDIYEHLIYTGQPFANILNVAPQLRDRTIVVNGLSKSFSMTGWRLGWAAAPKPIVAAMQKIQDQSTSNPSSITQMAAIAALQGGQECVEEMRKKFDARRRYVEERLAGIPGLHCGPIGGAFYAFVDAKALCARAYRGASIGGSSARLAEILLDEFQVAVIPGAPFGAEGYIRLSFATSMEQLEKGLDRIAAFARSLD